MSDSKSARLAPLPIPEWDDEIMDALGAFPGGLKFVMTQFQSESGDMRGSHVLGIFANYPALAKAFLTFNNHVAANSSLTFRERELLILRTGWLRKCEYEFVQHIVLGKRSGLTEEEIAGIQQGPDAAILQAEDALLVRAADELHKNTDLSDATYLALSEKYNHRQIMDIIGCVGCYTIIAFMANSLRVPMEEGAVPLDDTTRAEMLNQQ
ncbi:carboxymuconolactone decarboxylase family protein [Halioxenophilus sp. WMMB6]|uniref:carboxymuconolactone decarboxylase family protein n=1 Tax=Halioxenophilus sp. WMMB6 TaxID=3073815 RepID=UPI00295EA42C|nr:carboxymuconolactone decarboxylase family protein [Halioxenophilus sp. WMMB6]